MTWGICAASAASILAGAAAAAAAGQQTTETFSAGTSGAAVYWTYCATCHGAEARGDGPLAQSLMNARSVEGGPDLHG